MNETKSPGAICASWWHRNVGNDDGAARMTRARLHRCSTPAEALCIEAVHRLNAQLRAAGYHPGADRLALVAIVLAHVAESGSRKLAETFGPERIEGWPPCTRCTTFPDPRSNNRLCGPYHSFAPGDGHRAADAH